jgi:hypothetical protein
MKSYNKNNKIEKLNKNIFLYAIRYKIKMIRFFIMKQTLTLF